MTSLRLRTWIVPACIAALVCGASGCRRPLARAKFEKIELGMSEADVTKLVGKPDSVTKMRNMYGGFEADEYPAGAKPPEQYMYAYMSGIEFAQVYFEDGRVFGVRYNNEFLKGDWMEGESALPAEAQSAPSDETATPAVEPSSEAEEPSTAPDEYSDDDE